MSLPWLAIGRGDVLIIQVARDALDRLIRQHSGHYRAEDLCLLLVDLQYSALPIWGLCWSPSEGAHSASPLSDRVEVGLGETVGGGQSWTVVAGMTDFFCVLMLAGAGDELQGIKRGLMELADFIAVNGADGDDAARAERAAHDYRAAVTTLHPYDADWLPPVLTCSAIKGDGVGEIWQAVARHRAQRLASGALEVHRRGQRLRWMWDLVDDRLLQVLQKHPAVAAALPATEAEVRAGNLPPTTAARRLIAAFTGMDASA